MNLSPFVIFLVISAILFFLLFSLISQQKKTIYLDSYAGKQALRKFIDVAEEKGEPGSEEMRKVRYIKRNKDRIRKFHLDMSRKPAQKAYERYKEVKDMY